ncbi:hypothetical protein PQD13_gp80 [Gordonia phage Clawz]|uniref:Uncharacterized protein n=1 Tax=Gordonia phage Clawz TaxID=2743910 RepID=A0AAE7F9R0_9CAUD|nr:hypothetical protein PQD13_gp80 [Gordonia phage Clawz]QKY79992.1 hypothetical protein SEA_CLAWZ_80 [Gordonia phage Clawz]
MITTADGKKTAFVIYADGSWSQWGGTTVELGETVHPIEAMVDALAEHLGENEENEE